MKRVLIKSLYDAFEYVMEHFYPFGYKEKAIRKDNYVVISLQDSYTGGIGFQFAENDFCKGVLTLLVDDITKPEAEKSLFSYEHAKKIIDFIFEHQSVETLLVHCYGGQSRSTAVGAAIMNILGGDNSEIFESRTPNTHIYNTLSKAWRMEDDIDIQTDGNIELDLSQSIGMSNTIVRQKIFE